MIFEINEFLKLEFVVHWGQRIVIKYSQSSGGQKPCFRTFDYRKNNMNLSQDFQNNIWPYIDTVAEVHADVFPLDKCF